MTNLDSAWQALFAQKQRMTGISLGELLQTKNRFDEFSISIENLVFDFSREKIDVEVLGLLHDLASAAEIDLKKTQLFEGHSLNLTEQRAVLHMALRGGVDESVMVNGRNVSREALAARHRFLAFAESIRSGTCLACSGKPFTDVVNIGIGGSDLGPSMAVQALTAFHDGPNIHFISNIDGDHVFDVLNRLDCETTLVIVSSKSFKTLETLHNFKTVVNWLEEGIGSEFGKHLVAISTNLEMTRTFNIDDSRVFGFWDWVGGRYSVWSAIGLPLAIAIGREHFIEFLDGARQMDEHFRQAPASRNIPLMYALLGIWRRNIMNWPSVAVIPYNHHLNRLPAYLQQLDMESNGKSVDRDGRPVSAQTGPLIWGEPGTNSQHSFFQWLHQGTDTTPVDFILFARNSAEAESERYSSHHYALLANAVAQARALALGRQQGEVVARMQQEGHEAAVIRQLSAHRTFAGERPSTTLLFDCLTPYNLGRLLTLYEHKVFVQGMIWKINPYDQWGVELGKEMAAKLQPVLADNTIPDDLDGATKGLIAAIQAMRSK